MKSSQVFFLPREIIWALNSLKLGMNYYCDVCSFDCFQFADFARRFNIAYKRSNLLKSSCNWVKISYQFLAFLYWVQLNQAGDSMRQLMKWWERSRHNHTKGWISIGLRGSAGSTIGDPHLKWNHINILAHSRSICICILCYQDIAIKTNIPLRLPGSV